MDTVCCAAQRWQKKAINAGLTKRKNGKNLLVLDLELESEYWSEASSYYYPLPPFRLSAAPPILPPMPPCVHLHCFLHRSCLSSQQHSWNPFPHNTSGLLTSLGWGEPCCHRFLSACLQVENFPRLSAGFWRGLNTVQKVSDLATHMLNIILVINLNPLKSGNSFTYLIYSGDILDAKQPSTSGITCQSNTVCIVCVCVFPQLFCYWELRVANCSCSSSVY